MVSEGKRVARADKGMTLLGASFLLRDEDLIRFRRDLRTPAFRWTP